MSFFLCSSFLLFVLSYVFPFIYLDSVMIHVFPFPFIYLIFLFTKHHTEEQEHESIRRPIQAAYPSAVTGVVLRFYSTGEHPRHDPGSSSTRGGRPLSPTSSLSPPASKFLPLPLPAPSIGSPSLARRNAVLELAEVEVEDSSLLDSSSRLIPRHDRRPTCCRHSCKTNPLWRLARAIIK
jgi:hypothetical protein